jgi:hypothetical protein
MTQHIETLNGQRGWASITHTHTLDGWFYIVRTCHSLTGRRFKALRQAVRFAERAIA